MTADTTGQPATDAQPGARMKDGSVYAGISPDTHKPLYTTPADAPLTGIFNKAVKYAAKLTAHGHKDWRLPSPAELDMLYANREAIGGFDTKTSAKTAFYWASPAINLRWAWVQRFRDGKKFQNAKANASAFRCVRD